MSITSEELKQRITDELMSSGFTFEESGGITFLNGSKDSVRQLHKPAQTLGLQKNQDWIVQHLPKYLNYFAHGTEVVPAKVKPSLVRVEEKWHSDLFRLARLLWSLPYTSGFGRRLRYLLLDENNNKLIGIFGLQSPPIHFPARDVLFDYPEDRKTELINQMMDIYTLGAIPPYNRLLGGKLVGLATASNEVRADYAEKYTGRKTEMEGRIIPAHLVALTTTSAFGRSSIYNRLKFNGNLIAESLGYTKGYGNFHLHGLYPVMKEYLEGENISIQGGYGTGPKRTWQLIRTTLNRIGLSGDILKHGVKREAFLFRLTDNLDKYLQGETLKPAYRDYPFDSLADYWKTRWLIKRAERISDWQQWDNHMITQRLILGEEQINEPTSN